MTTILVPGEVQTPLQERLLRPEIRHTPNHGHPWSGRPGFDLLEIKAPSEEELTRLIRVAEERFWSLWIRDNSGRVAAVLYKPTGIRGPWHDSPHHPYQTQADGGAS